MAAVSKAGDNVQLTVGRLPYPPGRQPDRPLDHLIRQSPGEGADVAGKRKVTVEARPGLGPRKFRMRQAWGSALSELRRLNAELLAAAGQLKPVTIEALLRGGPGTGFGLEQGA